MNSVSSFIHTTAGEVIYETKSSEKVGDRSYSDRTEPAATLFRHPLLDLNATSMKGQSYCQHEAVHSYLLKNWTTQWREHVVHRIYYCLSPT